MAKYVDPDTAYENLANAIVLSAVKDYKRALLRVKRDPENEAARRAMEREEKFFYGPWYEMLTDLDPSYLIRKMKESVKGK